MNNSSNPKRQSNETGNELDNGQNVIDQGVFIGKENFLQQFRDQLKQFEDWNENKDWLAFHHHHYDWWTFPIDEISSRGNQYRLTPDIIQQLKNDQKFIAELRQAVRLMVKSWNWDIDNQQGFKNPDDKQKWSHWPVRLYKAGKSMWLFEQDDYYASLKKLARKIKDDGEKLDYYSHTVQGKADVLEQWKKMETTQRR